MVERGADPNISRARRGLLRAARGLTTPLLPDDYIELMNPLWSTRELRGRVVRVQAETAVEQRPKPGPYKNPPEPAQAPEQNGAGSLATADVFP